MNNWVGTIFVAALSGFAGAGLVWILNDGTTLTAHGDKFDVFRDLLLVSLALLATGGIFTFQVVSDRLRQKLIADAQRFSQQIADDTRRLQAQLQAQLELGQARLTHRLAYAYWEEYEELWRLSGYRDLEDETAWAKDLQTRSRVQLYVELAIKEGERALKAVERGIELSASNSEEARRGIALIPIIKSALAYSYATRVRSVEMGDALRLARDVDAIAGQNHHRRETVAWVRARFSVLEPADQKEFIRRESMKTVSELLQRGDIDLNWRRRTRDKYEKCFPEERLPLAR